jgi:hypothetical protein
MAEAVSTSRHLVDTASKASAKPAAAYRASSVPQMPNTTTTQIIVGHMVATSPTSILATPASARCPAITHKRRTRTQWEEIPKTYTGCGKTTSDRLGRLPLL